MIKRLASIAVLSLPLSLLSMAPASAECSGLGGLLGCAAPAPAPASQPAPAPAPQPAPAPAPAPAPGPAQPGTIAEVPGAAGRLLELVNAERTSRGLQALSMRADVVSIAHPHSAAMAAKRSIWHNDSYFSASTRNGLGAKLLGENVAMNSSLEDAHRRLMNSPHHRDNILDGRFSQAGFSVVHDQAGQLYVTENFLTPADTAVASAGSTKKKASVKASRSKKRVSRARTTRRARSARSARR